MRAIKSLSMLVAASLALLPGKPYAGEIRLKDGKGTITFDNEKEFVDSYFKTYASWLQTAKNFVKGSEFYFIVTSDCYFIRNFLLHPEDMKLVQRDDTYLYESLEDALKSEEFQRALQRKWEAPYVIAADLRTMDLTGVYGKDGARVIDGKGHGMLRILKPEAFCTR